MKSNSMASKLLTFLKSVFVTLRIDAPAKVIWAELKAYGLAPWEPLVPVDAFTDAVDRAVHALLDLEAKEKFGKYLEFGVSRGTSMACVYHVLERHGLSGSRLIGFDSFQGMPPETTGQWRPGQFRSELPATQKYLKKRGVNLQRVDLVSGWFSETLTDQLRNQLAATKTSLIMIDCDIYSASKQALDFCGPLIETHAVLIFDDWGWQEDVNELGQKEAFEEFMVVNPALSAQPLKAYIPQARIFLISRAPETGKCSELSLSACR